MSHMEQATLENGRICESMLYDAERKLDKIIEDTRAIRRNSSSLIDSVIDRKIEELLASCQRMKASVNAKRALVKGAQYRSAVDETMRFVSSVNTVDLQVTSLNRAVRTAFNTKLSDRTDNRSGLNEYLDSIDNPELRSVILILSKNKANDGLSLDELKELSESILDPSKKVRRKLLKETVSDVESEMKAEKLSPDVVERTMGSDEIVSPLELRDRASAEIFDERLRRSAVQAIVKSITAKDFIVDKSDIRHIKEGDVDQVKITARKPAGQTAEFLIDLNGKFVYHFQGYEGKACEKDITPMEKDLEEIYGIKLTERKTLWENPDKLQRKSHLDTNVRRGH